MNTAHEAAEALDRIARLDGYRVHAAADGRQRSAWHGCLAVFEGSNFRFSADRPDSVRAWLYDQAVRAANA